MNICTTVRSLVLLGSCALSLYGCEFSDPTEDDNGDKIPLIRADLPRFDASYTFRFVEADALPAEPVSGRLEIAFAGKDGEQLVTEAGRIRPFYTVTGGMLELHLNPNIGVSASNPAEFTVTGTATTSGYLVLPYAVRQGVPGQRNIDVPVIDLSSASSASVSGQESRTNGGFTVTGPDGTPVSSVVPLREIPCGNGYAYLALYRSGRAGIYACRSAITVGTYDSYGLYRLTDDLTGEPAARLDMGTGEYFVLAARRAGTVQGNIPLYIEGPAGTAAFRYTVETSGRSYSGTVSGMLPLQTAIEQIPVTASDKSARITLAADEPYSLKEETIDVTDVTAGEPARFEALTGSEGFRRYDLRIVGYCATDKSVTYAVTKSFFYSPGTKDEAGMREWRQGRLTAGKTSLWLEPGRMYTFRISINNEWYDYDITTDPARIGQVLDREQASDYITRYALKDNSDGTVSLEVEIVNGELCNL